MWVNGVQTQNRTYNAANQVSGWTYDAAGNLLSDGTSTYTYDALDRVTTLNGTTNTYNSDGVLVAQTTGSTTTNYTQDLAAPLSQILSDGTNRYVYGNGPERLFATTGSTRTWYATDVLGSVRATLNDAGTTQAVANYDPWGVPETSTIAPFGFTGELQQGNNVYLRARWYAAGNGAFTARDTFEGMPERPYSLMPYQYGYANPLSNTDPSGRCSETGDDYCYSITTWQEFEQAYGYRYYTNIAATEGAKQFSVRDAVVFAEAYCHFWADPVANLADISPGNTTLTNASVFAQLFLGGYLLADDRAEALYYRLSAEDSPTPNEELARYALIGIAGMRQYEPDRGSNSSGPIYRPKGTWVDLGNNLHALPGAKQQTIGRQVANEAKEFYNEFTPTEARQFTVAIAETNGKKYVTVNGNTDPDIVRRIQTIAENKGWIYEPNTIADLHAERLLHQKFKNQADLVIGVSNSNGPCWQYMKVSCTGYFQRQRFSEVYWDSTYR